MYWYTRGLSEKLRLKTATFNMSKHLQISTMHVFYKSLQYKKMYKGFQPFFCPQKKKTTRCWHLHMATPWDVFSILSFCVLLTRTRFILGKITKSNVSWIKKMIKSGIFKYRRKAKRTTTHRKHPTNYTVGFCPRRLPTIIHGKHSHAERKNN